MDFRLGSEFRILKTGMFMGVKLTHRDRELIIRLEDALKFRGRPSEDHLDDIVAARAGNADAIKRLQGDPFNVFLQKDSWEKVAVEGQGVPSCILKAPIGFAHLKRILTDLGESGKFLAAKLRDHNNLAAGLSFEETKQLIELINRTGKLPFELSLPRPVTLKAQITEHKEDYLYFGNADPEQLFSRTEWSAYDIISLIWSPSHPSHHHKWHFMEKAFGRLDITEVVFRLEISLVRSGKEFGYLSNKFCQNNDLSGKNLLSTEALDKILL